MTLDDAIEAYLFAVFSLSVKTRDWYEQKLKVFREWCTGKGITLESLTVTTLRLFAQYLTTRTNPHTGKQISTYTQHGYMQVVKSFLSWCSHDDDMEGLVKEKLAQKVPMTKREIKVIDTFTPEQIKALFAVCRDEKYHGLEQRDKAVLAVLFDTGIRASELCGLTLDNVHLTKEDAYLKVYGKGNKWREVPLGNTSRAALHKYIHRFRPESKRKEVFLTRSGDQFTISGLGKLFDRLETRAHIKGVRCSPHTCRHTFAVSYLSNGGDVYKLSRLMGHTSVSVTEHYLRAFRDKDARKGDSVLDKMS